ncbi:MAG: F0F1 ATP synthase subunit A [Deltaproteobacteria bacterium]|nr:F0F1 ATP synthase subunit A [Deltaproteobacteria bacterium]
MTAVRQAEVVIAIGPIGITDTALATLALSLVLVLVVALMRRTRGGHEILEVIYAWLEGHLARLAPIDPRPLVPLIVTQWIFVLAANLSGLLPRVHPPTADLSVTAALAAIAFVAGHVHGFATQGWRYLAHYVQPNPLLLPFNIIGELSRTIAMALRLFGNMMSGQLIAAILTMLVGLLLPLPLMLLSVLTAVVQAYIFGVLTLVFTTSTAAAAAPRPRRPA